MKFQTKYAGLGGFFGQDQDGGKAEVLDCKLLKSFGDSAAIYRIVLHDLRLNPDRVLDIQVINRKERLLIDDVIEYD